MPARSTRRPCRRQATSPERCSYVERMLSSFCPGCAAWDAGMAQAQSAPAQPAERLDGGGCGELSSRRGHRSGAEHERLAVGADPLLKPQALGGGAAAAAGAEVLEDQCGVRPVAAASWRRRRGGLNMGLKDSGGSGGSGEHGEHGEHGLQGHLEKLLAPLKAECCRQAAGASAAAPRRLT